CMSFTCACALVLVGLTSRAMTVALGTSSRMISSCFGPNSKFKLAKPVTLPPGRFMLATRSNATGSTPTEKTNRYCFGRCLAGERCGECACGDYGHLTTDQFGRQCR